VHSSYTSSDSKLFLTTNTPSLLFTDPAHTLSSSFFFSETQRQFPVSSPLDRRSLLRVAAQAVQAGFSYGFSRCHRPFAHRNVVTRWTAFRLSNMSPSISLTPGPAR